MRHFASLLAVIVCLSTLSGRARGELPETLGRMAPEPRIHEREGSTEEAVPEGPAEGRALVEDSTSGLKLSEVLRNDVLGMDSEGAAQAQRYADGARAFVEYRRLPDSRAGVKYRRECEENPGASALCSIAVDLPATEPVSPDLDARRTYVDALRAIDAAGPRPAACATWSPRLRGLLEQSTSTLLRPSILYWLARCAALQRKGPEAREWTERLAREFPLSLHARNWLAQIRDPRLTEVSARLVDPPLLFRSAARPELNNAIGGLEALYRGGFVTSAVLAASRLAKAGAADPGRGAAALEPEVRLYVASIAHRLRSRAPVVHAVNELVRPLFRERPAWLGRATLEMIYPLGAEIDLPQGGRANVADLVAQESGDAPARARLLLALIHRESGFNPSAQSDKGAFGLVQILLATAREQGARWPAAERPAEWTAQAILDPRVNVRLGTENLQSRLDLFRGDPAQEALALAGYHAGNAAVARWREQARSLRDPMATMDLILMSPERSTSSARYAAAVLGHREWYSALYPNWPNRPAAR